MSRRKFCSEIDAAAESYRKEKGENPKTLVLTQDEYIGLSSEIGRIVHNYRGMKILVRWGMTSNKAISI